jgi:hypothetical protein
LFDLGENAAVASRHYNVRAACLVLAFQLHPRYGAAGRSLATKSRSGLRLRRCDDKREQTFRFLSECEQPNIGKGYHCGRSSVVERQLPKLYVEGSIPFARSST